MAGGAERHIVPGEGLDYYNPLKGQVMKGYSEAQIDGFLMPYFRHVDKEFGHSAGRLVRQLAYAFGATPGNDEMVADRLTSKVVPGGLEFNIPSKCFVVRDKRGNPYYFRLSDGQGLLLLTDMTYGGVGAHKAIRDGRGWNQEHVDPNAYWFTDMRKHLPEASERVAGLLARKQLTGSRGVLTL